MYERIRNLREDHDLKQEDIARLLHCTQACCSNFEFLSNIKTSEALNTKKSPAPQMGSNALPKKLFLLFYTRGVVQNRL